MNQIRKRAKREWYIHQFFAWMMYLTLIVVTLFLCAIGLRFVRPQVMVPAFSGFVVLQLILFFYANRIVRVLMHCAPASGNQLLRLEASLQRLMPYSGLRRSPSLWVSSLSIPNAFAYGNGLTHPYNVAVTESLLSLLTDEELDAVLAHELGHIRARDVWAMTIVSATLGLAELAIDALKHIGRVSFAFALLIRGVRYIPHIVVAAISQLREFAADAYSVSVLGTPDPLIRAFDKLVDPHSPEETGSLVHTPLDDLLVSHPHMQIRKHFLNILKEKP